MNVFFDFSAMAKRYVHEAGTETVAEMLADADMLGVSAIVVPEVVSAFVRRKRERTMTAAQLATSKRELLADLADMSIVPVSDRSSRERLACSSAASCAHRMLSTSRVQATGEPTCS